MWKTVGKKYGKSPQRGFESHLTSAKHADGIQNQQLSRQALRQGSILQQLTRAAENSTEEMKQKNRELISKLIETTNYLAREKMAVKSKFENFVKFTAHLGVKRFEEHLKKMNKNATYLSHFSVDEFIDVISLHFKKNFLDSLHAAGSFALLADESTDEAGRPQFSIYTRFVDAITYLVREEFVCIRKLSADQTAQALMQELENMFIAERINKQLQRFSGMDGCNTMSGENGGLARHIRHGSPHCLYLNCRNHRLALCLVHLLRVYPELQRVDEVMLTLWKFFKNSSVRTAVYENAQEAEGLKKLKILKASVTRWLTHGQTAIRIINRFSQLISALEALYSQRNDTDAKGIKDKILRPNTILMLLVLAEALVPINIFSRYLQSLKLNYLTAIEKFKKCIVVLKKLKEKIRNYCVDDPPSSLKYLNKARVFGDFISN